MLRDGVYDEKVIFQLKGTFSAHSCHLGYLSTLVLWNGNWNSLLNLFTCAGCFRFHCAWAVVFTKGEIFTFSAIVQEHWWKPVFQKGDFFHQCSRKQPQGYSIPKPAGSKPVLALFQLSKARETLAPLFPSLIAGSRLIPIEQSKRDSGSSIPKPVGS